jgi:predicted dehydrogenase
MALCAGAAAGTRLIGAPAIFANGSPGAKLGTVVIGCGGRGAYALSDPATDERLVAVVDVDENNIAKVLKRLAELNDKSKKKINIPAVKTFTDYRKMFETIHKDIDAVFIATPNHHHALPSLMAMKLGKHVYCEKPMAYTVAEGRQMAAFARQYKVATQMGNQGHSAEGVRRFREYIEAGAIGQVTEVHTWTDRSNGGVGPRPPTKPVPAGLHWDEWIGPAPFRAYHEDLHPHEWHNWRDFGNGSIGNMGCHILDPVFWVFELGHPDCVEAELIAGGSAERHPIGARIRWDFPARGKFGPLKLYWYEGVLQAAARPKQTEEAGKTMGVMEAGTTYRPPIAIELEKKYNRNFGTNGAIYVGEKGVMVTDAYGAVPRIIPEEKHKEFPPPEKRLPRIPGTHYDNFLRACRGQEEAVSNFEYASRLTEIVLLGNIATKAGVHKKVQWDGENMRVVSPSHLNRYLKRENRRGWNV